MRDKVPVGDEKGRKIYNEKGEIDEKKKMKEEKRIKYKMMERN